jgi:hypothetical protein
MLVESIPSIATSFTDVRRLEHNAFKVVVGDGDYDRVERQTGRRRSSASPRTIDGQTVANSRVKSTV